MTERVDLPVYGMDCSECAAHVKSALEAVPGVGQVEVFLNAERARVDLLGPEVNRDALRQAVHAAGYRTELISPAEGAAAGGRRIAAVVLTVFALVVATVFLVVVLGEWFGLLDGISDRLPWWVALLSSQDSFRR